MLGGERDGFAVARELCMGVGRGKVHGGRRGGDAGRSLATARWRYYIGYYIGTAVSSVLTCFAGAGTALAVRSTCAETTLFLMDGDEEMERGSTVGVSLVLEYTGGFLWIF